MATISQETGMWMDALRVCKDYLPAKLQSVQAEYDRAVGSKSARDAGLLLSEARQWEASAQYSTAVSCYLKVIMSSGMAKTTVNLV